MTNHVHGCDNEDTDHGDLDGERIRDERMATRRGARIETFGRGQIRESEERLLTIWEIFSERLQMEILKSWAGNQV